MALKKVADYILLALSCLAWAAIFALPLLDISLGEVAALATGLVVAGEVAFFLGIALLGREAWEKIKAIFSKGKSQLGQSKMPDPAFERDAAKARRPSTSR